jgi:hypothetical protein
MHSSDSSSGVLQPTAVTNMTHPHLSTTLLDVDEKLASIECGRSLKKNKAVH